MPHLIHLLLLCCAASAAPERPNVLFIAIDDFRPELACYGDTQAKTPNIDKLASESLIFNRAYCQVPVCGASRASMMTSILPTESRFVGHNAWAEKEAPAAKTLGQVFKEAGYTTISNGKIFHHTTDTQDRSWSEPAWMSGVSHMHSHDPATTAQLSEKKQRGRFFEAPDVSDDAYGDGLVAEKTVQDLRKLKKQEKPFFLACGFIRPHLPFYAPKKYWDLYDPDEIELAPNRYRPENAPQSLRGSKEFTSYHSAGFEYPSDAFHRKMRHGYLACASYADKLAGDVLNELEKLGLADNTIVVIWGDHGWHLGEHDFWGKHNTMHLALRVPLIIKVPGKTVGQKTNALIEVIDLFPTLCSLAGLPIPKTAQGKSFDPLFSDPELPFRDVVYSRYRSGDAVINDLFAFTRYENGETMLYDHQSDPDENFNIADQPGYQSVKEQMIQLLDQKIQLAHQAVVNE